VPFLMEMDQISKVTAASAIIAVWVGVAVGSPFVGWLSDRLGYRRLLLLIPKILGFIAMMLIIFVHVHLFILYILLFFVGFSASGQALSFALSRENNKAHVASTACGFNNMATFLSGALLQPLVGIILDVCQKHSVAMKSTLYSVHDYQIALGCTLPICYVIGIVMVLFFIKETYCMSVVE